MMRYFHSSGMLALVAAVLAVPVGYASQQSPGSAAPAKDLSGIWEATRNFGPALRGPLTITDDEGEGMAEIAGQRTPVKAAGNTISCVLPGGQGELHGILNPKADEIRGHWIQPQTVNSMSR